MIGQLTQRGIKIPEQVSIMGLDDIESAKYAKVSLSTVKLNFEELGYEGAKLLFENSSSETPNSYKKILLSTQLVIRESVKKL